MRQPKRPLRTAFFPIIKEPTPMTSRTRLCLGLLALLATMALGVAPASATVIHHQEASFNGADAPGGPFGVALPSAAVDQTNGDVYVLESLNSSFEPGAINRFDESRAYAGVHITGAAVPQGSFAFALLGSGVAVDNSAGPNAGDLYVADTEHGVVDRFSTAGVFDCQITGKVPVTAEEKADECNGAVGSEPVAGPAGITPTGLAVDSSGELYVADNAHGVIDEFAPTGAYTGQIVDSHLTTNMATIALDSAGDLYVVNFEVNTVKFDPAGVFQSVLSTASTGVAVDPADDHVFVSGQFPETGVAEYAPSGELIGTTSLANSVGLAVAGSSGRIYSPEGLEFGGAAKVRVLGPDVTVPTVTTAAATGVTESSATLNGHIDPDAAHGGGNITGCEFEYGTSTSYGQTASCSPAPPLAAASDVSATVSLTPATTYHFRLKAENANGPEFGADETFTTPGPPTIDDESSNISSSRGTLSAQINPFGSATSCEAQYVTEATFNSSGYDDATTVPCSPTSLAAGFGAQSVTASISGLQSATNYHFRFLAENTAGSVVDGQDQTFTTFGLTSFAFEDLDSEGHPYSQAGGHPYEVVTSFSFPTSQSNGQTTVVSNPKDIITELPAGLIGNPTVAEECTRGDLFLAHCSGAAQIGFVELEGAQTQQESGLYRLKAPVGVAAEFGAVFNSGFRVYIDAKTRTGGDYGITAEAPNNSTAIGITAASVSLWGVPADPSHDAQRRCASERSGEFFEEGPCSAGIANPKPFLSNPTSCGGPLAARLAVDSWQNPNDLISREATLPAITGCNAVKFNPDLEVKPSTTVADSPTGLHVDLHVPQTQGVNELATANLKDAKVVLPPGLLVNPSAANGLEGCSAAQVDLHGAGPANCPDASKVGSVEVDTPLVDHPLPGSVYIAKPFDNPFNSLLGIYIAVDDPISGVVVKLAGHVEANPSTGQLTTTFADNPQLPFEDFKLDFFPGQRAALRTPATCNTYQATSQLTPFSAPDSGSPATPTGSFPISSAPGGGACPTTPAGEPNAPSFEAGTEHPNAGTYSPFVLKLSRNDGSQELIGIDTTLPKGLLGRLAGVPYCSEAALTATAGKSGVAEQASPSCPSASQVGVVDVAAGAGSQPLHVQGKAYLAGPYKGAALSLAIITPAVAGPFDLGTVVVRTALNVDPLTAQIHAVSDPLPTILQGIPLDLRSIALSLNRPNFTLNPTSCDPAQVTGAATSILGNVAPLSQRFQVGGCGALGFKPSLELSLKGATKRSGVPALKAVLTYPKGSYANIKSISTVLPRSEFIDNAHIGNVCSRVQFNAGAGLGAQCPKRSVLGHATAYSPLLDKPLKGTVYLRSNGGERELPDLVAALKGQIDITLVGFIDAVKKNENSEVSRLRTRFMNVPDAPVSRFVLQLAGAKKGLLENSANLCKVKNIAQVKATAQNGKTYDTEPAVANDCGKKGKKSRR